MNTQSAYEQIMQDRHMEYLEDIAEAADGLTTGDIRAGFPEEDCLTDILQRVQEMVSRTRGDNRAELKAIAELIVERESELARAAEYGANELDALENQLELVSSLC